MRCKVIQDFANVCCQMFLTSMANYDRINFVIFGSGNVWIDFLGQRCLHNRIGISPLHYCVHYRAWLENQCVRHHIDLPKLTAVELSVDMIVETDRSSVGLKWLTTKIDMACSSTILMDGIEYKGERCEKQEYGLGQIIHNHTY